MSAHPTIPGFHVGLAIAGAVILGLAAIAAFSRFDAPQRTRLETVSQPSAVEDRAFFRPPEPLAHGDVVLASGTIAWAAASPEPIKLRDTQMMFDDQTAPPILYRKEGAPEDGTRYLKVDVDRYLPVIPLPRKQPTNPHSDSVAP